MRRPHQVLQLRGVGRRGRAVRRQCVHALTACRGRARRRVLRRLRGPFCASVRNRRVLAGRRGTGVGVGDRAGHLADLALRDRQAARQPLRSCLHAV